MERELVELNVGGVHFTTTLATLVKEEGSLLAQIFREGKWQAQVPADAEGRAFLDRDGQAFRVILAFLRDGVAPLPEIRSRERVVLRQEAAHFRLHRLLQALGEELSEGIVIHEDAEISQMKATEDSVEPPSAPVVEQSFTKRQAELEAKAQELEKRLLQDRTLDERGRDLLAMELQKVHFELDSAMIQRKGDGKRLRYNLLIVGVSGSGKSSSLNTLLNMQVNKVSGAQAQGTRGCVLRDATFDPEHFVSYIDTQGLGADTSVSDEELLSQIMVSTESILKMGIINNILISFDVNSRTTPAVMANQLTLMELFTELRRSCFLVFTKWNTNAVMVEWNTPLREWVRKWKRAKTREEITDPPPSYEEMYKSFCRYVISALSEDSDGGAFSKMGAFLAFFEARVLWMFNLDAIQQEDRIDGALEPYNQVLYEHYRARALEVLDKGSTRIVTDDLSFFRQDEAAMRSIAAALIKSRDERIFQLEEVGRETRKRRAMKRIFSEMAIETEGRIHNDDYRNYTQHTNRIAGLAGFVKPSPTGCLIS